jgi:hypothetical protein
MNNPIFYFTSFFRVPPTKAMDLVELQGGIVRKPSYNPRDSSGVEKKSEANF